MNPKQQPAEFESILGAIERAKKLPDAVCAAPESGAAKWEHEGVWIDDWGRNDTPPDDK
jgi:hypothetical protein